MQLVMTGGLDWSLDPSKIAWINMDMLLDGRGTVNRLCFRNQWEKDYLIGLLLVAGQPAPTILLPGDPDFGDCNRCALLDQAPPMDISNSFITVFMQPPY